MYVTPADISISATWQDHKNRNPPSSEPGTDYETAYGTDLRAAYNGTISVIDKSNGGGEGRRLSIDLDDGRRVSYIHLSNINAFIGQRVSRGQQGFMWSGASGNGSDWYYGPHVHVSLWEHPGMAYRDTINFQNYVGEESVPEVPAPIERENEEMFVVQVSTWDGGGIQGRTFSLGQGQLYVCLTTEQATALAQRNNRSGNLEQITDAHLQDEFDARSIPREMMSAAPGTNWSWGKDTADSSNATKTSVYTIGGVAALILITQIITLFTVAF
jgi:hypothetical protein